MNQETGDLDASVEAGKKEEIRKVQPTLFIGLGGTGMEIVLRIRRRILHAAWGEGGSVRLESLDEFPVAEFMHFDLDQGAHLEEGRSAELDPLADLVILKAGDRIVNTLDLLRYSRNQDDLQKYPNILAWFPLSAERVRALGIDPAKGAGQMRPISRLYFFDQYSHTRDMITQKLDHLKAARESRDYYKKLGLKTDDMPKVRIVVIGSVAGGTGSGSFLDMGWLARLLAGKAFGAGNYDVQMVLFTPRGYAKADRDQTEANGYAALMELETCMRQYPDYVGTWLTDEGRPALDPTPYTDVYLVESANMGRHALEDVKDVYEMVADALFEDFFDADFAARKRSIAVNQAKHKALPYHPPVPDGYGELKLRYHMGYSSFGQAILDTQYARQRDEQEYRWCAAMLEAFFCISGQERSGLRATDQQRDEFLGRHLKLDPKTFDRFPDFEKRKELRDLCLPFIDNQLTDDLMLDEHGSMEDTIQQKVNALLEGIKLDESNITEWPRFLRDRIPNLEQDVIRNHDTSADTTEDRIERRCSQLVREKKETLRNKLYDYLDNQEYGGLEFVLSLVALLKTAFDHPSTGLGKLLEENAHRYQAVRDSLKTHQIEISLGNIAGAVEKGFLKKPDATKAKTYLHHLKNDLGDYLRFHLRYTAARNAAKMLRELSGYLGTRCGTDDKGSPLFTGLIEEFQAGRRAVLSVSDEIRRTTERIEDSGDKRHANYILLKAQSSEDTMPDGQTLRGWANEAFKDFEGSRKIFPMLESPAGKAKLLSRLRSKAVAERARTEAASTVWSDPLVDKLREGEVRKRHFPELLRAAMPWIDADFKDVPLNAQKFKCLLGVGKVEEWEPFLEELRSNLPIYAGITTDQLQLRSTGIPGRAVCYCELSGFPLCVLRGLDNWRVSYRKVSRDWPLHTNIDPTIFVHPIVPSSQELKTLAADFRLFLLAVILRILIRNPRKTIPPGQYFFDFGHGDRWDFGNERAFRINGLPPEHRQRVGNSVNEALGLCDALHLAALSVLASFFARVTYAPKMAKRDTGEDYPVPGFSNAVALKVSDELRQLAKQRGLGDDDAKMIEGRLIDWDDMDGSLNRWSETIADSAADAYDWEVAAPNELIRDRAKRRVKKDFVEANWLETNINGADNNQANTKGDQMSIHGVTPPPLSTGNGPPPSPHSAPVNLEYWLHINGQNYGPYSVQQIRQWLLTGQVLSTCLTWRQGMVRWQALNTLEEFPSALPTQGMPPFPPSVTSPPSV